MAEPAQWSEHARMAKSRSRTRTRSGGTNVVVVEPPAPIARRRRSSGAVKKRGGGRRRGGFRTPQYTTTNAMLTVGAGGLAIGWIEKHYGDTIPTLPFVGKKGAVALAIHFFKPKNKWIQAAGIAAAAISGYELGTVGHVTGEDDDEGIASQM
jgi:hypothetical protein